MGRRRKPGRVYPFVRWPLYSLSRKKSRLSIFRRSSLTPAVSRAWLSSKSRESATDWAGDDTATARSSVVSRASAIWFVLIFPFSFLYSGLPDATPTALGRLIWAHQGERYLATYCKTCGYALHPHTYWINLSSSTNEPLILYQWEAHSVHMGKRPYICCLTAVSQGYLFLGRMPA